MGAWIEDLDKLVIATQRTPRPELRDDWMIVAEAPVLVAIQRAPIIFV
jgi:hypothetical protein